MTSSILAWVGAALLAAPAGVTTPLDTSTTHRGASALAFDPAAAADVEAPELQLRLLGDDGLAVDRVGFYGVVPAGDLALEAGYDWIRVDGAGHRRLTLGLAASASDSVRFGLAYRRYRSGLATYDGVGRWDAALLVEPWRWLSLSLVGEALNHPRVGGLALTPTYRFGLGVRPLDGAPWLTLGAEGALRAKAERLEDVRLVADLSPLAGLHARIAYLPREGALWFGLGVGLDGAALEAGGAASSFGDTEAGSATRQMSLTLRGSERDSLFGARRRRVELVLMGDLTEADDGLFGEHTAVATAPLRLLELARDPSIGEVILSVGALDVGLASIDELRAGIAALRRAGKKVTVELGNADEKAYLIAAAADHVRMDTAASLSFDGFAVRELYLADALAKIGVRFEAVAIGKFKTAPDALTRGASRPEEREVQTALLAEAMKTLKSALAARGIDAERVDALLATGLFTAEEAKDEGLVDELTQPVDPKAPVKVRTRGAVPEPQELSPRPWGPQPTIAVVPLVGTIAMEDGDNPLPGATAVAGDVVAALEAARSDGDVLAVVLRIDSPGGDVTAADLIWREVRRVQEVKPVVVSMGDVAASGGYYAAAPASVIIAEPNTVTGSIGIFALHVDLAGLLERTAIHAEVFESNPGADWQMQHRPLSKEGRARLEHNLGAYYEAFLAKVATGRKLPLERVRAIAQGRVYSGAEAKELGLVDAIGGLDDAIREAKVRAGLKAEDAVAIDIPRASLKLGAMLGRLTMASRVELPWERLVGGLWAWQGRALALMPMQWVGER